MSQGQPLPAPIVAINDVLGAHHREVEASCLDLMCAITDDAGSLTPRWEKVEHDLFEHMAAEERMMLPVYRHADPMNVRALLDEHSLLRESSLEIGIAIHVRTIHSEHLQRFVDKLRAHARHEEVSLYRWAQRNLDYSERRRLHARVR